MSKVLSNCTFEELENEMQKRLSEEKESLQKRIEEINRKLSGSVNLETKKGNYDYFGGLKQCIIDSFDSKPIMNISEISEFVSQHSATKSSNVKLAVSQSIAKSEDVIKRIGRGLYEKI